MCDSNEYLLRQRQQQYGATGSRTKPNVSQPPQSNTNNREPEQYNPVIENDPNSFGNLMCEKWNIMLFVATIVLIALVVTLIIAFK